MSDPEQPAPSLDVPDVPVVPAVPVDAEGEGGPEKPPHETIAEPAKLLRIATMVRELLDETRQASMDEAGRKRLAGIYDRAIGELGDAISDDLEKSCISSRLRWRGSRRNRSSGSRRRSSSAGSRASSTASRRRCSPSRRPHAPSSRSSAAGA